MSPIVYVVLGGFCGCILRMECLGKWIIQFSVDAIILTGYRLGAFWCTLNSKCLDFSHEDDYLFFCCCVGVQFGNCICWIFSPFPASLPNHYQLWFSMVIKKTNDILKFCCWVLPQTHRKHISIHCFYIQISNRLWFGYTPRHFKRVCQGIHTN